MSGLEELLNADPKTQIAVIATKVYKMDEKMDTLCSKVDSLRIWRIKVVASVAAISTFMSFLIGIGLKLASLFPF